MIYGYNQGYYDYILQNPPEGMAPPEGPIGCNDFLDCTRAENGFATLECYKPVLEKLYHPELLDPDDPASARWSEMAAAMDTWGRGSLATGYDTWRGIMGRSTLFDQAYEVLVDLSGRFILVAELSLLPCLKGYADQDAEAGRCGLLQQAGMIVWASSYFMGLASGQPEGVFPVLKCP